MNYLNRYFYIALFSFAIFTAIIFYEKSLSYYFFQDDFFEINISKASSVSTYLEFFKFRPDIIAYRPISLQNYFFFSQLLFSLNPIGFRTITFVLFLISAFLIAKLIEKITHSKNIGALTAIFWVTSSIHFMSLSWIAAAYNIVGTFFFLLTSVLFLNFLQKKIKVFYILSFLAFLITVGSFEFSVTWPAIFGFLCIFVYKKTMRKVLRYLFPFIIVTAAYMILRTLYIRVPQITEYAIALNLDSAKAFFWYLLWALNVPEEFKKQVVNNLIIFNPKFFNEFVSLIAKIFVGVFVFIFLALVLPLYRKFEKLNKRIATFFVAWFIFAVSPVLIIPNHTFIMYLTLASIGAYALLAQLLISLQSKKFVLVAFLVWIFLFWTTVTFYRHNFWMVNTQKTALDFAQGIKRQFPHLPHNSVVLYPLNSTFERQALLENHAIVSLYDDPTLTVYYNKEGLIKDLDKLKGRPIYTYLP